jgi:hypothetical protein
MCHTTETHPQLKIELLIVARIEVNKDNFLPSIRGFHFHGRQAGVNISGLFL